MDNCPTHSLDGLCMAYGSTVLHIANASLSAFWILLIVKYPFKILFGFNPCCL